MAQGLTRDFALPAPTGVGQVLAATGTTAGAYSWQALTSGAGGTGVSAVDTTRYINPLQGDVTGLTFIGAPNPTATAAGVYCTTVGAVYVQGWAGQHQWRSCAV